MSQPNGQHLSTVSGQSAADELRAIARPGDDVITLCNFYLEGRHAADQALDRSLALCTTLRERHGYPTRDIPAPKLWGDDPLYRELTAVNAEHDRLCAEQNRLLHRIAGAAAPTPDAALAKLRVAIACNPLPQDSAEPGERVALSALADAERMLSPRAAPGATRPELRRHHAALA